MKKKLFVKLLLLSFIICMMHSHKTEELDFIQYIDQLNEQYSGDSDQILEYIDRELENKKSPAPEYGINLLARQHYLYLSGKTNFLFKYSKETEQYLINHKQDKELLHHYSLLASITSGAERYKEAYTYIYKGEQIAQKIYDREENEENLSDLIAIKYLKAIVALEIGMEQEANAVFLDAEELRKNRLTGYERVDIYSNILIYYHIKNNNRLVEEYGNKVLDVIYEQDPDLYYYKNNWYKAKLILATNYLNVYDIESCIEIIEILNDDKWVFESSKRISEIHHLYADVLRYYERDEEALNYLIMAYDEIKTTHLELEKIEIVEDIIAIVKKINDVDQLNYWHQIERDLMKSMLDITESQYLLKEIIDTDLQNANYYIEVLQLQRKNINYFVSILLGILGFSLFSVIVEVRRKKLLKTNMKILEQNLQLKHQYYEDIKRHMDNLKHVKHDLKNHVAIIHQLIVKKDYHSAQRYIQKIEEELVFPLDEVMTQNKIINAILIHKSHLCRTKGIDLELDILIPNELPFDELDLCVIYGNLLDNAIEACEQMSSTDVKYIKLKSCIKEECFYLNIKNSFSSHITKSGHKFITHKNDKTNHGFGLKNVKKSVKKYNGHIKITHENLEFNVAILLNI